MFYTALLDPYPSGCAKPGSLSNTAAFRCHGLQLDVTEKNVRWSSSFELSTSSHQVLFTALDVRAGLATQAPENLPYLLDVHARARMYGYCVHIMHT